MLAPGAYLNRWLNSCVPALEPKHCWLQGEFRVNQLCKLLCRMEKLDGKQADAFKSKIQDDYRVNMWVVDPGSLKAVVPPHTADVLACLEPWEGVPTSCC